MSITPQRSTEHRPQFRQPDSKPGISDLQTYPLSFWPHKEQGLAWGCMRAGAGQEQGVARTTGVGNGAVCHLAIIFVSVLLLLYLNS